MRTDPYKHAEKVADRLRSFLALLGAAVVAAKLPPEPLFATPLQAFTPDEVKSDPVAYFRRWYVTGVDTRWDGGRIAGNVWPIRSPDVRSARVRLSQVIMTEEEAKKTPPTATIDYREIRSACVDQPVEHFQTLDGPMIVMDMPAVAEVEIGIDKAMILASELGLGGGTVEFVGALPL